MMNIAARFWARSMIGWWALLVVASACGNHADPPASASSGGAAQGGASGGGVNGGAGGAAGAPASGAVPAGFTLTSGLQLLDVPKCDDFNNTSCSGNCVTEDTATNGCQAVALVRIFSELARDENGTYFSLQGSGNSDLAKLDPTTGMLVDLAAPPGDNEHVRLALGDDVIYFDSQNALFSIPRAGGAITPLLPHLPFVNQFVVVGQRLFASISLSTELDEIALSDGTTTVHARDVASMVRDGSDIYFAQADALYRAPGADFDAAVMLAAGPAASLLGVAGDWIYALGGADAERAIRRYPKAGGEGQIIWTLGSRGAAALSNDALVFTLQDSLRQYVCTVDLEGKKPTIVGYLSLSGVSFLASDPSYVYAVTGFNLLRFKR
jgi:hypothetical protein